MFIDFLLDIFEAGQESEAIVWKDRSFDYSWLLGRVAEWQVALENNGLAPGEVVMLEGDFSPSSAALLLALIERGAIIVPLTAAAATSKTEYAETAQVERIITIASDDTGSTEKTRIKADHELYAGLRAKGHPGLVLFSSGSTGKSKGAVHDFSKLLEKFKTRRKNFRTLAFLLFDHIGGIDTFFYSISNGSCVVTIEDRSPDSVCAAIEKHKVEVLPVSPTFLNLLLMSEAYKRHDLSSLKYITYGTEVMPETTLKRCAEIFPGITILQKYGTTEVGTLRSKSKSSDSTWVKVGGEGYQTRIVDGMLQIKAESAMLGYLNAPSPFTDDGWFITGDQVEQEGEFIRFLGRKSEIINVGGEKVFPAEVENIIKEAGNVAEAEVYGEKNPIMGNIVCARVKLENSENSKAFIQRLKIHCRGRLPGYKVPVKIDIVENWEYSSRFKKIRTPGAKQD